MPSKFPIFRLSGISGYRRWPVASTRILRRLFAKPFERAMPVTSQSSFTFSTSASTSSWGLAVAVTELAPAVRAVMPAATVPLLGSIAW